MMTKLQGRNPNRSQRQITIVHSQKHIHRKPHPTNRSMIMTRNQPRFINKSKQIIKAGSSVFGQKRVNKLDSTRFKPQNYKELSSPTRNRSQGAKSKKNRINTILENEEKFDMKNQEENLRQKSMTIKNSITTKNEDRTPQARNKFNQRITNFGNSTNNKRMKTKIVQRRSLDIKKRNMTQINTSLIRRRGGLILQPPPSMGTEKDQNSDKKLQMTIKKGTNFRDEPSFRQMRVRTKEEVKSISSEDDETSSDSEWNKKGLIHEREEEEKKLALRKVQRALFSSLLRNWKNGIGK